MRFWPRRQGKGTEGQQLDHRELAQASKYGFKVLYEPDEPELANIDIVFIHGLDGHRERSWMADGADLSWPQSLLPQKLPQARILTFGYDARYVGWGPVSTNLLHNHATTMLHALVHQRDQDDTLDRPLFFVAHSLGGLVCADALVSSSNSPDDLKHLRTISECTRGIAFLGTPHSGSALATWAQMLRKSVTAFKQTNKEILAVLGQDSAMLQEVRNSFDAMIQARAGDGKRAIAVTCFYEELPVVGLGREIVSKHSAQLLGYPSIGIHANHMDMTKFKNENDPDFLKVAGELRRWMKDFCKLSGGLSTIPFQLNPDFVGRKDVLREIDEKLKSTSSPKRRIALHGLGGIGKTQILVQYGYKKCQSALSTSVFWVSASSCASFLESYEGIASKLNLLNERGGAPTDVLLLVKDTLESKGLGEWIMIVDNADDLPHLFVDYPDGRKDLLNYLPEDSPNSILYSSRIKKVACQLAARGGIISVDALSPEESKSLLREKLRTAGMASTPGEGWSELLADLEYLPLAIVQAVSYMLEHSWTVAACLQHYRADISLHMLKHEFRDTTREERGLGDGEPVQGATNAVSPMFAATFSRILSQDPYAAELLCLMAVYGWQPHVWRTIPRQILQEAEGEQNDVRFARSMGTLTGLSLVTARDDNKSYKIHRLVQVSIRDWLYCHDQRNTWVRKAMVMISKPFPDRIATDQDEIQARELGYQVPLDLVAKALDGCSQGELEAVSSVLIKSSTYWGSIEQIPLCMSTAETALGLAISLMPGDKLSEAPAKFAMAKALFCKGEYDSADDMCRTALQGYGETVGLDNLWIQDTFHLLGSIMDARGKGKEALGMLMHVVYSTKTRFGLDQAYERGRFPSMALSFAALTYHVAEPYEPSFHHDQVLEDALKWTIEHKGAESRAARLAMTDLATSLVRGNLDRAWDLNEGALRLKGEPLDPKDPHTRNNLHIRTLVLYGRNENVEAERWARVVLDSSEKALGAKHPKTLGHVWILALVLMAQQKWEESEKVAGRAYEGYTELYGPDDTFTTDCQIILDVALDKQCRVGYRWAGNAIGVWRRVRYTEEEMPAQRRRVYIAEELPYEFERFWRTGVEMEPKSLEAFKNHYLLRRLPRRHFDGYVKGTLYKDSLCESDIRMIVRELRKASGQ